MNDEYELSQNGILYRKNKVDKKDVDIHIIKNIFESCKCFHQNSFKGKDNVTYDNRLLIFIEHFFRDMTIEEYKKYNDIISYCTGKIPENILYKFLEHWNY